MANSIIVSLICSRALSKVQSGEVSALGDIYDCLSKELFALALAITGDYALAEDVMQETFIKIIENIGTYRKDGNAKAWIMKIARNTSLDIRKRKYRCAVLDFPEDLQDECDTESVIIKLDVVSALNKLSEIDRQIVVLKTMLGLSHKQISEIVELSKDTTEKRYQRAIKKLNSLLKI